MMQELLLVNSSKWPSNPEKLESLGLGEPFDVKPLAWPPEAKMSHRAYEVLMTGEQYRQLRKSRLPACVTIHHAGTKAKPIPVDDVLASIGLRRGATEDE